MQCTRETKRQYLLVSRNGFRETFFTTSNYHFSKENLMESIIEIDG